jgi:hypothetical protein
MSEKVLISLPNGSKVRLDNVAAVGLKDDGVSALLYGDFSAKDLKILSNTFYALVKKALSEIDEENKRDALFNEMAKDFIDSVGGTDDFMEIMRRIMKN